MTKKFEILPHTADARVKVFGETREELFKNALLAMAGILNPDARRGRGSDQKRRRNQKLIKAKINIQSPDINSLLVDFLSEVLYQSQMNKVIYSEVLFSKFSDPSTNSGQAELQAEIRGNKVDSFDEDIKAVTYHELEIKKSPPAGGFETIIVFDV